MKKLQYVFYVVGRAAACQRRLLLLASQRWFARRAVGSFGCRSEHGPLLLASAVSVRVRRNRLGRRSVGAQPGCSVLESSFSWFSPGAHRVPALFTFVIIFLKFTVVLHNR